MKVFGFISAAALVAVAACSSEPDAEVTGDVIADAEVSASEGPVATETEEIAEETAPQIKAVPVRVGLDGSDFDACGSYGQVKGLNPQGDNFLSVRTAPTVDAEELDRLPEGAGVSMCDQADGWVGIVYQAQGIDDPNCGTGSPVPVVAEYSGPCRSGWVSERFVELVAG